jgi:Ca-activated chloride channel family protein
VSFAAPHFLWLLLLAPAAAGAAAWLWRRRLRAQAAWAARGLWDRLAPGVRGRRIAAWVALLAVGAAGAALALARPRWGSSAETVERQGVDVVYVLDTSLSMATPDVAPSRLFAAKTLVRRLVEELPGNRAALVAAEGEAMVMSPLTVDAAVVDLLLDTLQPASLPVPGSLLAPALRQALALFPEGGKKHRAVVVISDGEDQGSALEDAGRELQEAGATIFAVGVGSPQGAPIPLSAKPGDFKRDQDGRVVVSRLREDVLERLARDTGGLYLRAASAATDPAPVVARIQAMEKRSLESEQVNTQEERFQWPLGIAVAGLGALLALGPFRGGGR